MKVLVIGGGGREHAMAFALSRSNNVERIFVAPGNAGTSQLPNTENLAIAADDCQTLCAAAKHHQVDLTIVGPEIALANGLADLFCEHGLLCLGPSEVAAQLESSKAYCKAFLKKHRIPTANYQTFHSLKPALAAIEHRPMPCVIKADGLAAGKGVVICPTHAHAAKTLQAMLGDQRFGDAGNTVVIEDFLIGEEASFIAICHGRQCLPLASSQDHKARDDGDLGPNTGGMGAYSPAPIVTPAREQFVMDRIIQPTLDALADAGTPFVGFLYAGLMISAEGDIRVLEFNCRLGDPETQVLLFRLQSDFATLCFNAARGTLNEQPPLIWDPKPALGVVMCAPGYPDAYPKGELIQNVQPSYPTDQMVFQAGTALNEHGQLISNGGRVLMPVASGESFAKAQEKAYALCNTIDWPSAYYRRDIGFKAL